MPLNIDAQKAKSLLSSDAQKRIDKLLVKRGVHTSDLNKILTSHEWEELAKRTFGLKSVFEINTIDDLNRLLTTPRFWQLAPPYNYIKSLFRKHYFEILKSEGHIGNIVDNNDKIYKNVRDQNETKRTGSKKAGWTKILPLRHVPISDENCFKPGYYSETEGHVSSDAHETKIDESDKAVKYAELLKNSYNIILHGAPGTGKTFLAKQIAEKIGATDHRMKMIQFHPSYDYTDFMEGLRPIKDKTGNIGFERRDGAFKEFCKKAIPKYESVSYREWDHNPNVINIDEGNHKYVFIIDEINRGEIAKILGECMFSIDPGYVGEKGRIDTQYQKLIEDTKDPFKDGFYRPQNVYIIGTMNDLDRGVESMDLAMRRRFVFVEINAEDTQEDILKNLSAEDKDIANLAMTNLNNIIRDKEGLGGDYCIGASYFLKIKDYVDHKDKWKLLWDYHLNGLFKEYLRGREDSEISLEKLKNSYFEAIGKDEKPIEIEKSTDIDETEEV